MSKPVVVRGQAAPISERVFADDQWRFDKAADYPISHDYERNSKAATRQQQLECGLFFPTQEDVRELVSAQVNAEHDYSYTALETGDELVHTKYADQEVLRVLHVRQTERYSQPGDAETAAKIDTTRMEQYVANMRDKENGYYNGSLARFMEVNPKTGKTRTCEIAVYFCVGMETLDNSISGTLSSEFAHNQRGLVSTNQRGITLDRRMRVGKRYRSAYIRYDDSLLVKEGDPDYCPDGPKKQYRPAERSIEYIAAAGILRSDVTFDLPDSPTAKIAAIQNRPSRFPAPKYSK